MFLVTRSSVAPMELTDEMQLQAKALADPSRFRLFRHIVELADPATIAELTEWFGFNHNNTRQHLAVLVEAGLVVEADERRTTRGRPRKLYAARLDALNAFRTISGSYQRLAELLLDLLASEEADAYGVGRRSVADERALVGEVTHDGAAERLMTQLAIEGFEPERVDDAEIVLGHCPFADLADRRPGIVCELHRGLIDGQLAVRPGLSADLIPHDPHRAGCQVVLRSSDG